MSAHRSSDSLGYLEKVPSKECQSSSHRDNVTPKVRGHGISDDFHLCSDGINNGIFTGTYGIGTKEVSML